MTDTKQSMTITPDSKVGILLSQYPHLEDVLMEMSPTFGHLRNPILRRTVGKVATLRQVAKIGNVSLSKLINTLRREAGMSDEWVESEGGAKDGGKPDWLRDTAISQELDARPIIAGGGHPLEQVLRELKQVRDGEVFLLITPFLPAPLLDVVKKQGYEVWTKSTDTGLFENFFCRTL